MSCQAYLDALEAKTGKTPQQLIDKAKDGGYGPETKAGIVVDWLKEEYGVGRGHAMALFGVLKNGPVAPEKHVGSRRQSPRRILNSATRWDCGPHFLMSPVVVHALLK